MNDRKSINVQIVGHRRAAGLNIVVYGLVASTLMGALADIGAPLVARVIAFIAIMFAGAALADWINGRIGR